MNVLVIGSGAREHAIAWKLHQQKECHSIWVHPGNAGTRLAGFRALDASPSFSDWVATAKEKRIDLVIIGPETFLEQGAADAFRAQGFSVVGPDLKAALLETSKVFSKEFLVSAQIPTAPFQVFDSETDLLKYRPSEWPWVLKLDGLASGKGVVIAHNPQEVQSFAKAVWRDHIFGEKKHRILAEQFLPGRELSYIGFCDGSTFIPLASSTDHKQVFDNNRGPNTGGMGAVSPSPFLKPHLEKTIHQKIIQPLLVQMKKVEMHFNGIIFLGLMVDSHDQPRVLEINTRFGDPETQAVLPRLSSSFLELLVATAHGRLQDIPAPQWDHRHCVYIVACTPGYPEHPQTGQYIRGLDGIPSEALIFYAGVALQGTHLVTNGGRVLGVGALGDSQSQARTVAYQYLKQVTWDGIHYRKDIASSGE